MDRRCSLRINLNAKCVIYNKDNGVEINAIIKDISREGIGFILDKDIEIQKKLKFIFCDEYGDIVNGECRVIRENIYNDKKQIGCKIISINPINYVEKLEIKDVLKGFNIPISEIKI